MNVCTKCGGEIEQSLIDHKKRIAARLYPGREVPPPKVCSACVWSALHDLDDDIRPASAMKQEGTKNEFR